MTKQRPLLNVPKMGPTRKETLRSFTSRVGIWTHSIGRMATPDFPKWTAMLLPKNEWGIQLGHEHYCKSDDPWHIIAGYCRIMQESGYMDYGQTERDAVQRLCHNLNVACEV